MDFLTRILLYLVNMLIRIGSVPYYLWDRLVLGLRRIIRGVKKVLKSALFLLFKANFFIKNLLFRKAVLYGTLSAIVVFGAFELGLTNGHSQKQKIIEAKRAVAPLKIFDRNGVLLLSTTVGSFEHSQLSSFVYKRAPDFVLYALHRLKQDSSSSLFDNGVFVYTTLDVETQNNAQATVLDETLQNNVEDGSLLVANTKTGDILALVSSVHYFDRPQNNRDEDAIFWDLVNTVQTKKLNPFISITDKNGKVLFTNNRKLSATTLSEEDLAALPWSSEKPSLVKVQDNTVETVLMNSDSINR
jgi:hypothetical protein